MFKTTKVCGSLLLAFGSATLVSAPALAQQTVEITGTRIKSIGSVSASPISSLASAEIQSSQPVAVEEIIRGLPSSYPAIGPGTNNGAGGGATIDLRALGPSRTLVLVDGRRFVPFNLTGQVDTNSIPLALLENVDIVTGGASAVYGADAVAGVANFQLRRSFKGFEVSTSYGISDKSDAARTRTDITLGAGFADGRGNVAMSFGMTDADAMRQDARAFGFSSISSTNGLPQGSATSVPAVFQIGPAGGGSGLPATTAIIPSTGTLVAYDGNVHSYNFNPQNYYVTPLGRTQITALGNFTVNRHFDVYGQAFYTRSDVSQQLASSGTFLNVFQVPIGNPFIPAAARAQICAQRGIPTASCVAGAGGTTEVPMTIGRRLTELGPRLGNFENKTMQLVAGVRGDINNDWTYDAYISRGEADQVRTLGNWGSLSKVQQALRALSTTACTNTANGCVPLNVFGAEGSVTPAMVKFINLDSIQLQNVEQQVMTASVSGNLGRTFKSPWTTRPIAAAFGVEYRKMTAGNKSDSASQIQGEVLGTGAPLPDRTGTLTLKEAFVEALAPIASNKPMIESLNLEAGFRHTEFTTTGSRSYSSQKVGGDWSPVKGLRFRAMQQKATRAPNINELFAPQVSGLSNLAVDPCQLALVNSAQANTAGTLSNLCRLTGVPTSSIGSLSAPSAGQVNVLTGGQPNLGPEEADTTTLGFVWEPSFVKGLSLTVDAYKIDLAKAVSTPSVTDVLDDCYTTARNPSLAFVPACALIKREPTNGTFNGATAPGIVVALSNAGKVATKGVDVTVAYQFAMKDLGLNPNLGRMNVSLNATQVDTWKFQATPSSVNRECVGFYSVACGGPTNKNRFSQRTVWTVGDLALSYNWRFMSSVIEEPGGAVFLPAYSTIGKYNYVDLGAVWNFNKNVRINASVNNVFDKQPPSVGNTISGTGVNSGNTFPQWYDVVGRYFTIGATLKF